MKQVAFMPPKRSPIAVVQRRRGEPGGVYEVPVSVRPSDTERDLPASCFLFGLDKIDGEIVVVAIVAGMLDEPVDPAAPRHDVAYGWLGDFDRYAQILACLPSAEKLAELERYARFEGVAVPEGECFPDEHLEKGLVVQAGPLAFVREVWPTVRFARGREGA